VSIVLWKLFTPEERDEIYCHATLIIYIFSEQFQTSFSHRAHVKFFFYFIRRSSLCVRTNTPLRPLYLLHVIPAKLAKLRFVFGAHTRGVDKRNQNTPSRNACVSLAPHHDSLLNKYLITPKLAKSSCCSV
jgi:hypothetical protein